jgi:diguanylate cyclase (GGDEF)-like protein
MPKTLYKSYWKLYFFIFLVSFLLLGVGTFFLWKSILNEQKTRLIYSNKIVSNSMESLLNKDEALFKLIGERLIELGMFSNPKESLNFIDNMLLENTELAGIGIADLNGDLRITTSNMSKSNLHNLLEKEETSNSFKAALNSSSLVMGRTYFMKNLNEWIVPIRFKITNKAGLPVAVLTSGLKLNEKNSPWQSETMQDGIRVSIINSDYYFQYTSIISKLEKSELYNTPISEAYLNTFLENLLDQTGLTLDDFITRKENNSVPVIYPRPDGDKSIAALSYNKKYQLFTFTINKVSLLYPKLFVPLFWMIGLLALFNTVLFLLIKYLNKIQIRSRNKLEYQAQHDLLTGLPNIRYLNNIPTQWLKKFQNSYSVIFIDLDNFKSSNDLHGHDIGDEILCEVASRINSYFKNCLNVRQGGDEFIIIAPREFSQNIEKCCHQFLDILKKKIAIKSLEFSVRASIGIASFPNDGLEINNILRKADIAMYEAKRKKCGVHIFTRKLDINNSRLSMISKELNSALDRNEMSIVYQPQYNADANTLIGFEALLRWNNQSLGQIPPDEFIPIAESTGYILDIGDFVLETAIKQFHTICKDSYAINHIEETNQRLRLSINISVRQLTETNFVDNLFALINKYECENAKLMLEITETMTINRFDEIASTLEKIQSAGIEISLDDFGTGYSSLSYLSKLSINEIKIDKSFIHDIANNKQNVTLIKSIIRLGESFNIKVLAEGVETEQQLKILNKHGCQYYQGYYFSYPLKENEMAGLFNEYLQTTA